MKVYSLIQKLTNQCESKANFSKNPSLLIRIKLLVKTSVYTQILFRTLFLNFQPKLISIFKLTFQFLISYYLIILLIQLRKTKHTSIAHNNPQFVIKIKCCFYFNNFTRNIDKQFHKIDHKRNKHSLKLFTVFEEISHATDCFFNTRLSVKM